MIESSGNDVTAGASPPSKVSQATDSKAIQLASGQTVKDVTSESVEDELVEKAVKFINETVKETIYKGYLEIGRYLFDKFYDSDIERVRSRDPKKKASLRKLKQHQGLALHPSTLHDTVRVAAQEYFFNERGIDTSQLTYTHKCELVKIDDNDEKIQLVQNIISATMSTRQLTHVIHEIKRKGLIESTAAESVVVLTPSKLVKDLKGLFDSTVTKRLDMKPEELGNLDSAQRDELKGKIGETLNKLKEVSRVYKRLLSEIKSLEVKGKGQE